MSRVSNRNIWVMVRASVIVAATVAGAFLTRDAMAGFPWLRSHHAAPAEECVPPMIVGEGEWYWVRSPEMERQVVVSLYNRYCIRCHGVDGRGVWDIPGVPDFSNSLWHATRGDGTLARSILEGRGAVMPPFRGTVTLEQSWALARYLRTLIPGVSPPRPDRAPAPSPRRPSAPAPAVESRGSPSR